ncbi:hypothetical protein Asp14428_40810 [Actinoplanes sp. NBRC 14428]|uniref:Beta-propeller uncharacterized protein DUF5122 n=1 Tax=Pseudosporangium ferrugineum TaxID=439699 RepID=A0A2T0S896_9ACTN|nr:hypothetical protein [Pseudosporangium ferrugineum]PRY29640.1 beta-propeller uncharacterized protein DUF5122 [Pseudosporangium ferrugineum]BCJ52606.1 hypothetical protein Asp14428_40810 [Actinoplanes sp. NBRC 14428]
MRFIHFARRALLTTVAATTLVAAGSAPALAVSAVPDKAPLFNGSVYAIAYRGSTVYVGGSFTSVAWGGRNYPRARLAAFDARSGAMLAWSPTANSTVRALAISGSAVYAGGDFTKVSGSSRDNLARIDAASGAVGSFSHRVSGVPYALAAGNGRLYAGGSFTAVDGSTRRNAAAFSLSSGALDGGWRPSADDSVHALAVTSARVYLGGAFHKVNGVSRTLRIAAVGPSGGAVDRGFLPTAPAQVNGLATDSAGVYAATGGQGGRAIAYGSGGGMRWQRVFDGDAVAIASLGGTIYVGGHFDRACTTVHNGAHGACSDGSVARVKLAAISSGGALTGWAPQANGIIGVRTLAVDRNRGALGAGGDFTTIGGQNRKRYASFD